jgi:hypothetical protein
MYYSSSIDKYQIEKEGVLEERTSFQIKKPPF